MSGAWPIQRSERYPAPETVSKALASAINARPSAGWNAHPQTSEAWKARAAAFAEQVERALPHLRERFGVGMRQSAMSGVTVRTLAPEQAAKSGSVLLHLHGGGYVMADGESGTYEATLMAGLAGYTVVSVDYRIPPDHPYPAALEDALTVYRELLRETEPKHIGVFGTSAGGGLAFALMLKLMAEGLPLPAAVVGGCPWTDLSRAGDSYLLNEGVDNVLVSYDGWLGDAAKLYAAGRDLKDPALSPVYGDLRGFPPTLITSGTRDLLLSNAVRMHTKLLEAEADARLVIYEGMSHGQYLIQPDAPESRFHFMHMARFFASCGVVV